LPGKIKRSVAPKFWPIPRKKKEFTVTTSSGPHSKNWSFPLAVILRDSLHLVKNYKEAETAVKEGKIVVDCVVRTNPRFPTGLMDVIDIPSIGKSYRLVPKNGLLLIPIEIPTDQRSLKLCKIVQKRTILGGRIQYGLHDGRQILAEDETGLKPGDVCLIEVPSQKIIRAFRTRKGMSAIVTSGERAGLIGQIVDMKVGTSTRRPMAVVSFGSSEVELPTSHLFTLGEDKPVIAVE
jgi:small subunit ribosomal protein S4e